MKLRPFYQIPFERNSSLFEYSLFCPQKNFHSASMILKRHLISFIKDEREERNYIIDIYIYRIECNQTYFKSILLEVSLICTVKYCICLIYFKVYLEHKLLKLNICKYQKFEQFSTSQHPRPYTSSRTSCSPSPPPSPNLSSLVSSPGGVGSKDLANFILNLNIKLKWNTQTFGIAQLNFIKGARAIFISDFVTKECSENTYTQVLRQEHGK